MAFKPFKDTIESLTNKVNPENKDWIDSFNKFKN